MSQMRYKVLERKIRLGFLPSVEGAPLAVACEKGIFERYGFEVVMSREVGWASIGKKLLYGQLDAAQTIAGIPLAYGLGIESARCDLVMPMVLNLQGSAITLSSSIDKNRIGRGEGMGDFLNFLWKKSRPLVLAIPHRYSTHVSLLKNWLRRIKVPYPGPVEIVVVPGFLMPSLLSSGLIDGFCSGEPWSSEAILAGDGWCPIRSSELARYHPESLLAIKGDFLGERRDQAIGLVAALIEACELCQSPEFRTELISILSKPEYVGASLEVIENSLGRALDSGKGRSGAGGCHIFHGGDTNRPSIDKGVWALSELRSSFPATEEATGRLAEIYREDLYEEAVKRLQFAQATTMLENPERPSRTPPIMRAS